MFTRITTVSVMALLTSLASTAQTAPPGDPACQMTSPVVADMTLAGPLACSLTDLECIFSGKSRLMTVLEAIPEACQNNLDIYVPGTNDENGDWKQFNAMFGKSNGRGHVVLKYSAARDITEALGVFEAAAYDQSTEDAFKSLSFVLSTIKSEWPDTDVDVFGHSKGSHAVSMAAQHNSDDINYAQFFAFAQPGRTAVDIDGDGPMKAAKLGTPGYIEKLSDNLVGITFDNDEVSQYKGAGVSALVMPESWAFPGQINTERAAGTLNASKIRIDHHNNYGGLYTYGDDSNDPVAGEGPTSVTFPYCSSGGKASYEDTGQYIGCSKREHTYVPWFWGHPGCESAAYAIMGGAVGGKRKIGASGPRKSDCGESRTPFQVSVRVKYKVTVPDYKDCDYRLKMEFRRPGQSSGQVWFDKNFHKSADDSWQYNVSNDAYYANTVTADITNKFYLHITGSMSEDEGFGDCQGLSPARAYIRYIKVLYTHPITGKKHSEYIVRGATEGSSYPAGKIAGKENVAWKKGDTGRSRQSWDLFWSKGQKALEIAGLANENHNGTFYKKVYLMD